MLTFIFNNNSHSLPPSKQSLCALAVGLWLSVASTAAAQDGAPPAPAAAEPAPTTAAAATPAPAPAAGPEIVLPEAAPQPTPPPAPAAQASAGAPGSPTTPAQPQTAEAATSSNTSIGGYAELHVNVDHVSGPGRRNATVDFHRFVLFVAHRFTDKLRFYSELELEHAVASAEDPGEIELEQAYLDYEVLDQRLSLRAGLLLVPMGIINQTHEPPMFHGVERPMVDTVIIPTTWREAGVGLVGELLPGLRYQLYLMSGLNAAGFSAEQGPREGLGETAIARTNGLAVSGRVEYEPLLGVVGGVSGYYGLAGPNADLRDSAGARLDLAVPVMGIAADARVRRRGVEARAELAYFHIGDTGALRAASDPTGMSLGLDVGSVLVGGYAEVAYDVLTSAHIEPALLPFVRLERYDTMAGVSGRARSEADRKAGVTEVVAGLTYRPVSQVAFKADYRWSNPDGAGPAGRSDAVGRADLGVGVMF